MEINDEFLLQCVSNYQPLYDKNHIGYKSCLQKENCWQSVARSLSTDVATVKARFKALREKYRRELQIEERLRRSGAPASTRPAWNLMSFFKFMNSRDDSRDIVYERPSLQSTLAPPGSSVTELISHRSFGGLKSVSSVMPQPVPTLVQHLKRSLKIRNGGVSWKATTGGEWTMGEPVGRFEEGTATPGVPAGGAPDSEQDGAGLDGGDGEPGDPNSSV
ncbi:hypothetical protein FQR65_LT15479 [Abscondita terminalis]|nr:hypothetical protein FQR65_LT15479 [Abscondita terminalis]